MKHSLLIIGDEIRINKELLGYIFDSYERHFGELGEIKFGYKNKDLPFLIEDMINEFDILCIFARDDSYATIAKILATLSSDTLELKDGENFVPKNALKFQNNSFLIKLNQTQINLIKANPTEKLGDLLSKYERDFSYFTLFDIDADSAKILLDPLAKTYEINISLSEIITNLVLIRAKANKFGQIEGFLQGVKTLFPQKMCEGGDIIKFIAERLIQKGLKISFAESCTAGLAAAKFARFSGVSGAFDGSLVTYANELKHEWLGVSNDVLDTYGAVSEHCVRAMLKGALNNSNADFALAISGVAGPSGGSIEKPVGTVFVGAASSDGSMIVERLMLNGERNYIREQSVLSAYLCLLRLKSEIFFA
ncbi:CinA family protein [Campylobacter sp. faydin G-24]|uniref:CinA family protein n=1 Tax=Campylobacter anatolicus TaxID=2829105 RepID=A0ABS5HFW0_9BACT|nr:CinA family protein [Campylobacter anatolicus]MBR8462401.1 CinA family protein [Campylobacter anatolicus]MBR8463150.1 CinA family protein [Campylobacter anatolicus]